MLKSGQLRETLTLQSVSYTKDDNHERVATWSDVCNVKASVVPRATSEVTVSERPEVQQLVDITMRYRKSLTVKNRFKHVQDGSTRYYEILSVTNRGLRNRVLDIVGAWRADNG